MSDSSWFVVAFRVSSSQTQQAILRLMHGKSGITALGTSDDSEYFVAIDCVDRAKRQAVIASVQAVDPGAVQTYATATRDELGSSG